MFSLQASVAVSAAVDLPDTFIEDVEFVICQTFLLKDGYDGIVNAATQHTANSLHYCSKCSIITSYSACWQLLEYLFQVALAPALFCFSPLSSGELFSLLPSSLRLGELISFSRCRVLMREI